MIAALACLALLAADPDDRAAYTSARDAAGRDPDAHVRLALWCEQHQMPAERLKHLALAVMYDPAHAAARGLLGQVKDGQGGWTRPGAAMSEAQAESRAEYNARRARLDADDADAQWRLALWCEENGLEPESRAHLAAVTRLDPGRDAAWKRLGCKKVGGRWVSPEQIEARQAERKAQAEANERWRPQLLTWKEQLGKPDGRDEAEAGLASVDDPRAVPSIWAVFVAGRQPDLIRAVQLLGQVDSVASSRALATLAAVPDDPGVRQAATETLRRRDPREFAEFLIALIQDEVRYEVRPVGGPGSPGVLFVEGQQVNVRRFYAPPPGPSPNYGLGAIEFDADGLPVVVQRWTTTRQRVETQQYTSADDFNRNGRRAGDPDANDVVAQRQAFLRRRLGFAPGASVFGIAASDIYLQQIGNERQTPIGQLALEASRAAHSAEAQLESDVAFLDALNASIHRANSRVVEILRATTGATIGAEREGWRAWLAYQNGYEFRPTPTMLKPTMDYRVPLAYVPRAVNSIQTESVLSESLDSRRILTLGGPRVAECFAAGTPVRTPEGARPIDSLQIGDLVLAQDVGSGALRYRAVLKTHFTKLSDTVRVDLGTESFDCTAMHRFWVAGKGWSLARELRPGEAVRTLDGLRTVASVEPGEAISVFNLDVDGDATFFVGKAGVLVHDSTIPDDRPEPFDRAPELATAAE